MASISIQESCDLQSSCIGCLNNMDNGAPCYYCDRPEGGSFCTNALNQSLANCTNTSPVPDIFVTNITECLVCPSYRDSINCTSHDCSWCDATGACLYAQSDCRGVPKFVIPSRYGNNHVFFPPAVNFYWLIDWINEEIEVALKCNATGFCAWGISRGDGMLDSDAYIGWVSNTNGSVFVFDYSIGDYRGYSCPTGVCLDTRLGGQNNVLVYNGSQVNGTTTIIFRRKLNTTDPKDIVINGTHVTIYSWSPADGPAILQHPSTPVPQLIDYFQTDASSTGGNNSSTSSSSTLSETTTSQNIASSFYSQIATSLQICLLLIAVTLTL